MARDYDPDVLLLKLDSWVKNGSKVTFPTVGVNLPNFSRFYRVLGTCHHSGSLSGGHWLRLAQPVGGMS